MINAYIGLAVLILTVVGDLILIPPFGVPGAAAASSFAYCMSLVFTAVAYRRLSGGSIAGAVVPKFSDATLYLDGVRSLAGRLSPARRGAGGAA
jgi:peptidoglycan biosynthesis protein MviN/MurJ (putative lipid II flippase)